MVRCLVSVLWLIGVLAETAYAQPDLYARICDASAAISLGGGRFVVAEDENINKLFTYKVGEPQPQSSLDLLDYLGNANGDDPRESDLEAAARISDNIFWISSHGADKDGVAEESRFRFFATPLANENGALIVKMPVKPPVKTLRDALIAEPRLASLGLNAAASKPPKEGGLSIEGLAATSGGALFIGLRSPLKDGKAIVIPLLNPAFVIDGSTPSFGDTILIDMSGRGIRSMERVGERYLILGGDPGEGSMETRLYAWAESVGATAVDLSADLGGLNGEALFETGHNEIYVLSDDGNQKIDGKKCKNTAVEKKAFRGVRVALAGEAAAAAPADAELLAFTKRRYEALLANGRYMEQNCTPVTQAGWDGFPTMRCTYTELGAKASVTLLDPDATQLARWTVTACLDAGATQMKRCAKYLRLRIWGASNAQFPVSGYVIEPKSVLGGSSNDPLCFLFRDGVTIRTQNVTTHAPENGECKPQSAETESASKAFNFARIASTSREEYRMFPGAPDIGNSGSGDLRLIEVTRKEWQVAWASDRNKLLSAAAVAAKAAGEIQ